MNARILPPTLTSYDLLKTFAVVTMIIDHIGACFYPDDLWWRVVGRLSVPVWLFLVGFAKSRDMSAPLWIGTAIIFATNAMVGQAVLPLCILATILASRLAIDPVMRAVAQKPSALYPLAALMFVLTIPLAAVVDYGASVFLFVMLGYMVRNQDSLPFNKSQIFTFAIVAGLLHAAMQVVVFFGFDGTQKLIAAAGIMGVAMGLTRFAAKIYDGADHKVPSVLQGVLRFCGRRSLEIYVAHLVVFKVAALLMGVEGYGLFNFHIY